MMDVIVTIITLIVCGVIANRIGSIVSEGATRILISVVMFVALLFTARPLLDKAFTPSIDKELQKDELFVVIKKKYPQDYQKIVDKIELAAEEHNLTPQQNIAMGQQYIQPLLVERLDRIDDKTRSHFTGAIVKQMQILRRNGHGECFDFIFGKYHSNMDVELFRQSMTQSGMDKAMLEIFTTTGFEKSIVAEKKMQETIEDMQKQLLNKYKQDVQLLANPNYVVNTEDKQKVCDMTIDMFSYLNEPNDKAKMATLRKILTDSGTF